MKFSKPFVSAEIVSTARPSTRLPRSTRHLAEMPAPLPDRRRRSHLRQGRHLRRQRRGRAARTSRKRSPAGISKASAGPPTTPGRRNSRSSTHRNREPEAEADLLHRALSHDARADSVRRRGRPVSRHGPRRSTSSPPGQHNYSTFSLWDTYRALHPLYTLMHPQRVPGLMNCLVRMAAESPAGMPVWPLQGRETGCMTGYHSVPVLAEAMVKGFQGIDYERAYPLIKKRAWTTTTAASAITANSATSRRTRKRSPPPRPSNTATTTGPWRRSP